MSSLLECSVKKLEISDKIVNKLITNSIIKIDDLWKLKRTDLKKY